jgi:hypothetical protein
MRRSRSSSAGCVSRLHAGDGMHFAGALPASPLSSMRHAAHRHDDPHVSNDAEVQHRFEELEALRCGGVVLYDVRCCGVLQRGQCVAVVGRRASITAFVCTPFCPIWRRPYHNLPSPRDIGVGRDAAHVGGAIS